MVELLFGLRAGYDCYQSIISCAMQFSSQCQVIRFSSHVFLLDLMGFPAENNVSNILVIKKIICVNSAL